MSDWIFTIFFFIGCWFTLAVMTLLFWNLFLKLPNIYWWVRGQWHRLRYDSTFVIFEIVPKDEEPETDHRQENFD